ncbi:MAG: hypothetical protein GY923_15335 [Aestuariibacter sp.]|nr:hypothetical protein [Aestuariibacter sp.]
MTKNEWLTALHQNNEFQILVSRCEGAKLGYEAILSVHPTVWQRKAADKKVAEIKSKLVQFLESHNAPAEVINEVLEAIKMKGDLS